MSPALLNAAAPGAADKTEAAEPAEELVSIAEKLPGIDTWLPESLQPAWATLNTHPWIGAVIVAVLFYLLALIVRGALFSILKRLTSLTESVTDDAILEHLRRPVFATIWLFGLIVALQVAQLPTGTLAITKILLSLMAVSWMKALLKISTAALTSMSRARRYQLIETRTVPLFDITSKLLIILLGSYVLLMIWGINPVGWLASAGIVGIAVGFAAKDTLGNLFSGFFIVADSPYSIGDYITLDTGERGKVAAIGLRSTRLQTRDDVEITIPNGVIAAAKIVNESGGRSTTMRIRVPVGVAYGSNVDLVCKVLQAVGDNHEETCKDPAPRVRMRAFGASSLDFQLLCWIVQPQDKGRITHELLMQVYKTLNDNNIGIPFPQQDVYIKELPTKATPES